MVISLGFPLTALLLLERTKEPAFELLQHLLEFELTSVDFAQPCCCRRSLIVWTVCTAKIDVPSFEQEIQERRFWQSMTIFLSRGKDCWKSVVFSLEIWSYAFQTSKKLFFVLYTKYSARLQRQAFAPPWAGITSPNSMSSESTKTNLQTVCALSANPLKPWS